MKQRNADKPQEAKRIHRYQKASNQLFKIFLISVIAQATFVVLFAGNFLENMLDGTLPSSISLSNFFAISKDAVSPLLNKFYTTLDVWSTVNTSIAVGAIVIRRTD